MAKLDFLKYADGSDSYSDFKQELAEKHHNEEERYIVPLDKVVTDFQKRGPLINKDYSKKFPPYKKLSEIDPNLAELRTKECRFFIYKYDIQSWIGLHGYEKQGQDMPKKEKTKVKGEIKLWKKITKNKS